MPLYLDTRGNTVVSVGICDRCKFKMPVSEMVTDPNSPGLRLHEHCRDNYDPYRLAPRGPDQVTIQHPRPDIDIST